jgi:hypothetical protein
MPRRRVNQSEVSATSGAKPAEVPRQPISRPCASANSQRLVALPAAMKPQAEAGGADQHRHHDAEAVREPAHEDAAQAEAHHGERVGQRGVGAVDAEFRLDHGQRDGGRIHAHAAERGDAKRDDKPQPSVG